MRLPDALLRELERAAKARHTTKSVLVRESLEKTLRGKAARSKSCFDMAQDLAGSAKGLPRDIATNPKHMTGFGE